nr:MAG TPA: hypothetical protein [Caudoviricetes sp.]
MPPWSEFSTPFLPMVSYGNHEGIFYEKLIKKIICC